MSLLWRKTTQIHQKEDGVREMSIKIGLTQGLGTSVKALQQQHIQSYEVVHSGDFANNVCHYLEAIFIHGLKDTFSDKVSAILANNSEKAPQPNFWPLLVVFSHKNVILQINSLAQIKTDIGRCRAWIRVALNDGLFDSYLAAMVQDKTTLGYYYKATAFFRDVEQPDIMRKYVEGLSLFQFKLACNSNMLNSWTTTPLVLAGIWTPPTVPEPVVTGIDVASCLDEGGRPITPDRKKSRVHTKARDVDGIARSLDSQGEPERPSASSLSSLDAMPSPSPLPRHGSANSGSSSLASVDLVVGGHEHASVPPMHELNYSEKLDLVLRLDAPSSPPPASGNEPSQPDDTRSSQSSLSEVATCGVAVGNDSLPHLDASFRHFDEDHRMDPDAGESGGGVVEVGAGSDEEKEGESQSPGIGNRLSGQTGWSSSLDEELHSDFNSSRESDSFNTLVRNSSPMHSSILRTPDFNDMDRHALSVDASDKSVESEGERQSPPGSPTSMDDGDFEILSKSYTLTSSNVDQRTRDLLAVLGKICSEVGLDKQNYQCKACGRPIGMIYGKARVCCYDGHSYCYECHENDEHVIPARIIHNWDFKKYKVAKHTKLFLLQVEEEPLIDVRQLNPLLYSISDEMQELQALRTQLSYLRSYLFTCQESVAEEMRKKLWPKEYLFEHVHLYSLMDLAVVPTRSLAQLLQKIVSSAIKHVGDCRLCSQKGFICEICNNPKVIYPFELERTYRCEKCLAVYHSACMDNSKPCPKCERRRKREDNDDFAWTMDD